MKHIKRTLAILALSLISVYTLGQNGRNYIKPINNEGFCVDSILSLKGNTIVYLRAGTEFDIEKKNVSYIEHSQLGRIDISQEPPANAPHTAPIPEPEYYGEAFICNFDNNTYIKAEKAIGQIKTKDQFWGPETKLYVKPAKSSVKIRKGNIKIVLKVSDVNEDPYSFIRVSKFSTEVTRKLTLARLNELTGKMTFGGREKQELTFNAKRYGESSFLLNLDITEPGEYCISIDNPNNVGKRLSVSCFGVYD